jgi:thiol-disulfide isomerase/thioredoxin
MAMEELHEQRVEFVTKVQAAVSEDLLKNGLELESVSLTGMDQTSKDYFNPDNAFDAEGLTKLTNEIEERRKIRNDIELDTQVAIETKNLEAKRKQLEISKEKEYAELEQERELEVRRANQATEIAQEKARKHQEAQQAEIEAEKLVKISKIAAEQAVETDGIAKEQNIKEKEINKNKAIETASIEQAKTIELLSEYNRVLAGQRIAKVKAKEGDFAYAAGLNTLKKWRETYEGSQLEPLVLAMSTGITGQDHAIHTQAVDDIAVDSWLWSLDGVSFARSVSSSGPADEELAEDTRTFRQLNHYDTKVKQFLAQNSDYDAKADIVMYLAYFNRKEGETELYQQYFDDFKENYTDAWSYDFYFKLLQPSKLDKGAVAPGFEIVALDNPDIVYSNSSFNDQVYLLDFWATWCPPCLKELPVLHEIYSRFNDKGFEILSLSANEFAVDVTEFRQGKWKMPWKHAFLQNGEHPIIESYDVFAYPTAYLIDENGKVLATGDKVRGEQLEQTLASYYSGK